MTRQSLLALIEGQLVDVAGGQNVTPIQLGFAALCGKVIRILWGAEIRLRVGDPMRIGVIRGNLGIRGEALLNAYL